MNFARLSWVAIICVSVWTVQAPVHAFDTELLVDSGPSSNRLDLVILGDGPMCFVRCGGDQLLPDPAQCQRSLEVRAGVFARAMSGEHVLRGAIVRGGL